VFTIFLGNSSSFRVLAQNPQLPFFSLQNYGRNFDDPPALRASRVASIPSRSLSVSISSGVWSLITGRSNCSPTGMFALPNHLSHVSSAALARARLRPGSSSAQVYSGLLRSAQVRSPLLRDIGAAKTNLTRNHQLLTRGLFRPLPYPGISNILPPYHADRYKRP
jgi:hypothetical protein